MEPSYSTTAHDMRVAALVVRVMRIYETLCSLASIDKVPEQRMLIAHIAQKAPDILSEKDLMTLTQMEGVDVVHDIVGLCEHFDLKTNTLKNCFLPRYAR